jgi:hypothetical protein
VLLINLISGHVAIVRENFINNWHDVAKLN